MECGGAGSGTRGYGELEGVEVHELYLEMREVEAVLVAWWWTERCPASP
jgi:hypothetical protein